MKTITMATALALALATLGAPTALANTLPLQNAVISASYNGDNAAMLGLDSQFASIPGSHISSLDPTATGVEFFTSDFLFGIDFSADGGLTIMANYALPIGPYAMRFDFGSTLANPISSFTFTGAAGARGVPVLSIIDAHTIALDLSAVEWDEFGTLNASIAAISPVPETSPAAMLLAGLASLAGWTRWRRRQQLG
ncbi:MAG: hypothetical protein ABW202_04775 [Duganella sp.]